MGEQLSLLSNAGTFNIGTAFCREPKSLNAGSGIEESLGAYETYLRSRGKSQNTIQSFLCDIRKLRAAFPSKKLSELSTQHLREFIAWFVQRGDKPKTVHRRVTALKNYFRWLAGDNIIPSSPAEALVFERVIPPLPDILDRKEAERFAEAALKTPFEHVVVMLILGAGLKRSELLALKKEHINISDPLRPTVKVKGKKHYTERILVLPLDFVQSYNAFVEQYKPESPVFKCTERSLNYVLSCIANRAGINKHVSCQILRDSFAVQCLRAGEKMDAVLKKLGLARTTANEETRHKYQRLLELYG